MVKVTDCESVDAGATPAYHPYAGMMELADILVLETSEETHIGSTPITRTLTFSSMDRMDGYEPSDASSILAGST